MQLETLRSWIRLQQINDGKRDGAVEAAAEIRALKRRNAELQMANVILGGVDCSGV